MKNNTILLQAKSFYQTTVISFRNKYFKYFTFNKSSKDLLIKKLIKRNFKWDKNKKYKSFLIFSINDWEIELLNVFTKTTDTYHFNWKNVANFFKNTQDWKNYHKQLNIRLKKEFDDFYNEEDNFLVFIYASDFSISKESINYLKRKNVLIVSFCWDDLLYFSGYTNGQPVGVSKLSKYVDLNFTLSPEAIPRYLYNNSPCFFWDSVDLNIKSEDFSIKSSNIFYVLFVGTNYGWRSKLINLIKKNGIEVKCYGSGWPNGRISTEKLKYEIEIAPLTLGFSSVGYTKNITTIKGRDFEVPLWKGLYLTQYSKGLISYYTDGVDLFTYYKDCINKIKFIKYNQSKSIEIRNNGYKTALNKTTWYSRILYLNNFLDEVLKSI